MKASLNNATNGQGRDSSELTAERATKAAYYLKEALALLGGSPDTSAPIDAKRESDRLLRLPEVQRRTGLRRSAIYEQMRRGTFPHSVKAGARAARWSEAAIQAWISERIDEGSV